MIYAVVGPTGVGKTKFSIELAKKIGNAEIVNCDSMQIYKEFDIGVAKIKDEEKENIPHHLFDIVSIYDNFSVYEYQQIGRKVIDDLINKNKNIIIVGGTGLYLKALLYDYNFKNKSSLKNIYKFKLIGLTRDRNNLYELINQRVDEMFKDGLLNEVEELYKNNKTSRVLNTAIGYKELLKYFNNENTLEEAIESIKQSSRRYAKRQYTFFNNQFDNIAWYNIEKESIKDIISKIK